MFRRTGANTARRLAAVQATGLASRAVSLAEGLVDLLNWDNAHAAPAVSRALYETCGVAAYMRRNLSPLLIHSKPEKAKEMLFRLGLGVDPGLHPGKLMPYRVSAFVKAIAQEGDEYEDEHAPWIGEPEADETHGSTMRRLYSALADLTHPNHSATSLALDLPPEGEPTYSIRPPLDDYAFTTSLGTAALALTYGGLAWDAVVETAQKYPVLLPRTPRP